MLFQHLTAALNAGRFVLAMGLPRFLSQLKKNTKNLVKIGKNIRLGPPEGGHSDLV
jgi:hypothetical protein